MCSASLADTVWRQGCRPYWLARGEYEGLTVLPRPLRRSPSSFYLYTKFGATHLSSMGATDQGVSDFR